MTMSSCLIIYERRYAEFDAEYYTDRISFYYWSAKNQPGHLYGAAEQIFSRGYYEMGEFSCRELWLCLTQEIPDYTWLLIFRSQKPPQGCGQVPSVPLPLSWKGVYFLWNHSGLSTAFVRWWASTGRTATSSFRRFVQKRLHFLLCAFKPPEGKSFPLPLRKPECFRFFTFSPLFSDSVPSFMGFAVFPVRPFHSPETGRAVPRKNMMGKGTPLLN